MFKVKVTAKFQNVNECPDDTFWIAEPLLPNLIWWCIIMSQIVFQKDWLAVFKFKITVKDYINQIWLFTMSSELLVLLQLNWVWWHIIIIRIFVVKRFDCCVAVKVKVPVIVHLDDISSTAGPSVTQLGMVMHHYRPECHARILVCHRVAVRASMIKYDCFYHIYWTSDLFDNHI